MTLFEDNTAHNLDSATSTLQEHADSPVEVNDNPTNHQPAAQPQNHDEKPATSGADDFASALESFTTETEEAIDEDNVIKGTVLKLTPTHVVVDIGAKSEGM